MSPTSRRLLWLFAVLTLPALGNAQQVQQTSSRTLGRYVIYYHPTNFNQALLLDSATGAVWELAGGTFKPEGAGSEVKEIEYRMFQRLGVEGLYKTDMQALQTLQLELKRLQKLEQEASEKRAVEEERRNLERLASEWKQQGLPSLEELRKIALQVPAFRLGFVTRLRRQWPRLHIPTSGELLSLISQKYPEFVREFPKLFEPDKEP